MRVKLGTVSAVRAIPKETPQLLVDKSQCNQVSIQTELEESLTAPVSKGQRIGTMTVRVGDRVLSQIPMLAEQSVPKLTWGQMFLRILRQICMAK